MKQTLFTLLALFISVYTLNAQCSTCTRPLAGTYNNENGFYPNPAVFTKGEYSEVLVNVVFPKDTTAIVTQGFPPQTIRFTSWKVTGVTNIPAGLSYTIGEHKNLGDTILPPNNTTPATFCFTLCGTPTTVNTISDSISLAVVAGTSLGLNQSATVKYRVVVQSAISIDKTLEGNGFSIYPQPVTSLSTLNISPEKANVIIEILDLGGKLIKSETATGTTYPIGAALQNQPNGMYIVQIKTNGVVAAQKIVKQD